MKAKLISTTRPGESYHKKQNIYFTCHPEDFSNTFQSLSEDILALADCAIWHLDPPDGIIDIPEHLSQIEGMQVIVIPITRKLLTTQNRAFDVEFPFAREHNILLLPILIEGESVIDLFNQKCGNLYLLDKYCTDSTATPYREKLRRFLSYALADEKQIEKIRELFAAHIFLSYRRRDREHAQRLIRTILSDETMRDISIFFDEFLTPGLAFDSTIEHEIKQCDLFALNLTPNLIRDEKGEPNYVLRQELPHAKAEKKTIIPVKTVDVDDSAAANILKIEEKTIIPLADETYNAAFLQALRRALEPYTDERIFDPTNPIHNYYLGVAYLRGVDVPVDREYGIQQINAAMEAGIEAMDPDIAKELARMYRYGQEVPYNIIRALYFFGYYLRGTEKEFVTIEEKKQRMRDWAEYRDLCLMGYRNPDANRTGHAPISTRGAIDAYEEMVKLQEEICEELGNPIKELRKLSDLMLHVCGLRIDLTTIPARKLDVSEDERAVFQQLATEACEKHLSMVKKLNEIVAQDPSRTWQDVLRDKYRLRDAANHLFDVRKTKEDLMAVIDIAEEIAYGQHSDAPDYNYLINLRRNMLHMSLLTGDMTFDHLVESIDKIYDDIIRVRKKEFHPVEIAEQQADSLLSFIVNLVFPGDGEVLMPLTNSQKDALIEVIIRRRRLNCKSIRSFWIPILKKARRAWKDEV